MVKIGMMIGDRYEILEKIGTGGMSDVYKAKCHKLNRFVAVKILKQEFSENANFVSKFRVEAQAAAGLMHSNIVNVYDVGEENGIHYIVMELVEGITLKKYIEKKARLSYKEAVSIAIQVSLGIEAAHNNHIIHRDIKPQNIIISKEGKVKVTDFGIAKAATSNTITSNVMGSVHYTSPEQARGGYSDEKSDIYSLGITLFEMLTGRVPFNGDTTVAIAIKHIQEELPSPKDFVPEIPASLEGIVIKCCQKSPDRRYQNMQELVADLKQSLMNPDEDFVVQNGPDMDGGTRMITDSEIEQIKRRTAYQDGGDYVQEEESLHLNEDEMSEYEESGDEYEEAGDEYEDGDEYDYNPRLERMTTILAVIAGIIICVIVVVLAVRAFGNFGEDDNNPSGQFSTGSPNASQGGAAYVKMPAVRGQSVEEAKKALADQGLVAVVEYEESGDADADVIIRTDVAADAELPAGSTVTLTASAGLSAIEVPKVTEDSYAEAESRLKALGFTVTKVEGYSDDIAEGFVIAQVPSVGTWAPRGTNITVTVSLGKGKVRVPDLLGRSEMDGTVLLLEEGLDAEVSYVYNPNYAADQICYQSYSQGSWVDAGTKVEIKVSRGAEKVTYRCNASIQAPTTEEAPDYVPGTEVLITLVTDDGQQLLEKKTRDFPQSANYYGLKSAAGTITMTYETIPGGTTTVDPVTGEMVNIPGTAQTHSFTRRIDFVQE